MRRWLLIAGACWLSWPLQAAVTTINFSNFSSTSGLNLVASAATTTGYGGATVLRLTPAVGSVNGAAWSTTPISFNSNAGTFTTHFQFQITNPSAGGAADGLVFVLQPVSSGAGSAGGGMGYGGITPSVAVEFDPWNNAWDPNSDNHVGVDINGSLTSLVTALPGPAGPVVCQYPVGAANCMANGDLWSVWIDYDGTNLVVALADGSTTRPATNLITFPINVPCVLAGGTVNGTGCPTPATSAFVGFTASTGTLYENNDIVSWSYTNSFGTAGLPATAVPALSPWAYGALAILMAAMGATILRKRLRRSA